MKLHTFPPSPNSQKPMLVIAALGLDVATEMVDLPGGAHKSADYLALNPNGRVPVLEFDDGSTLWESNAISNRLAAEADTTLWPKSNARYDIMRWQFWESCHWLPACSKFIGRHLFDDKSIDLDAADAALQPLAKILDDHLADRPWLVGDDMTTADISVAAILSYRTKCHMPLGAHGNITRWIDGMEATPAWQAVHAG